MPNDFTRQRETDPLCSKGLKNPFNTSILSMESEFCSPLMTRLTGFTVLGKDYQSSQGQLHNVHWMKSSSPQKCPSKTCCTGFRYRSLCWGHWCQTLPDSSSHIWQRKGSLTIRTGNLLKASIHLCEDLSHKWYLKTLSNICIWLLIY